MQIGAWLKRGSQGEREDGVHMGRREVSANNLRSLVAGVVRDGKMRIPHIGVQLCQQHSARCAHLITEWCGEVAEENARR